MHLKFMGWTKDAGGGGVMQDGHADLFQQILDAEPENKYISMQGDPRTAIVAGRRVPIPPPPQRDALTGLQ